MTMMMMKPASAKQAGMAGTYDECRRAAGADHPEPTASSAFRPPQIFTLKWGSKILRRLELIPAGPAAVGDGLSIVRTRKMEDPRPENPNKRIKITFKVGCGTVTEPTMFFSEDEAQEYPCAGDQALMGNAVPDTCSSNLVNVMTDKYTNDSQARKRKTLVLDLDETLLHSSFTHCSDPNLNVSVLKKTKKKHPRYVRWRPFLHIFLKKVAEMFEIVIFTAAKERYASQLISMMDPEHKLFSKCLYRDSCQVLNGVTAKDLRILGIDLAEVAIVDNSPHVYRLQVNNGIPIKSFYNDPSDRALIDLLPFLETLADATDVRPLIARRFSNEM